MHPVYIHARYLCDALGLDDCRALTERTVWLHDLTDRVAPDSEGCECVGGVCWHLFSNLGFMLSFTP